jgi:hypothetical protein
MEVEGILHKLIIKPTAGFGLSTFHRCLAKLLVVLDDSTKKIKLPECFFLKIWEIKKYDYPQFCQ